MSAKALGAPPSLGPVGAEKWRQLRPRLCEQEDQADLDLLEIYCASYERWMNAQKWLNENGDVLEIVSDKGVVLKAQPAPKLDVAARAEKAMAEAMRRLRYRIT